MRKLDKIYFQEEENQNDTTYIENEIDGDTEDQDGDSDLKLPAKQIIAHIQGLKPLNVVPIKTTNSNPIQLPQKSGKPMKIQHCNFLAQGHTG